MVRRLLIAGNWKMNKTATETVALVRELETALASVPGVDLVVCPPFTSLGAAAEALRGSRIALGAQNVHWAGTGAFTGEISAAMLKEVPVTYAIIGHSERRQYFAETDATVNQRLKACLAASLTPIVCVGETLAEREAGRTEQVVTVQVKTSLAGLTAAEAARLVVAYEPVWAIGTGRTATPEQAQEVHALIRSLLRAEFGGVAEEIRVLYGGSVKAGNAADLMAKPDIDGALVGGASLVAAEFAGIARNGLAGQGCR